MMTSKLTSFWQKVRHAMGTGRATPFARIDGQLLWAVLGLSFGAGAVSAAQLSLQVEARWRGAAIEIPTSALTTSAGTTVKISRLSALFSELELITTGGDRVRLEGQFGYIEAASGRMVWKVDGVPEGDYVALQFRVGVPVSVNHTDPGRWAPGHALNPLVNRLHWSWQGGYVFLALEGHWTAMADGATTDRGFSYHLATDELPMFVRFRSNFSVRNTTEVRLAWELSRVIEASGLGRPGAAESTHSAQNDALAPKLAGTAERAWFWLGAEESQARNDDAGEQLRGHEGRGDVAANDVAASSGKKVHSLALAATRQAEPAGGENATPWRFACRMGFRSRCCRRTTPSRLKA
jgi:hypothetical protein